MAIAATRGLGSTLFWMIICQAHAQLAPSFVKCETTKGDVLIKVEPTWAPEGAQRFLEMVKDGYL
eukprot:COSAG05_NODE_16702_length_340_cov_1.282158_1_plen_64_part_10